MEEEVYPKLAAKLSIVAMKVATLKSWIVQEWGCFALFFCGFRDLLGAGKVCQDMHLWEKALEAYCVHL